MASNLNYLDPSLKPLEEKIQAYLDAEKELQRAVAEQASLTHPAPQPDATTGPAAAAAAHSGTPPTSDGIFEQRPPTGSYDQAGDEMHHRLQNLHDDLDLLRQEIINMLPVRDEWIKVNLGYGPSRVGAFKEAATEEGATPTYQLRVVF
ncbi:hypothetical protein HMJ29_15540 [Hymenobacter taeanensis]|uniref:Uncharacterized protein n=1 Tax=Hymenobacter taeanensis TaxID=2735321 RepID=A0A6M6BLC9_9BACT|nr:MULTISPECIES: hypothetical protein [Hymenobacter]QJX48263.1 hypothetical protein HMJ29_15540 [Hymenobacter taeanensis]UOQ82255.1 hypothetical protein MUN83_05655 [Hymenobacter sp. 5414T-23]